MKKLQRARENAQSSDQLHSPVGVTEAPKNIQEEYLKAHCITSLQSERIPVFQEYLHR